MATKRPTLRALLEHLQHEIADVKARLAVLERPKIARVIRDPVQAGRGGRCYATLTFSASSAPAARAFALVRSCQSRTVDPGRSHRAGRDGVHFICCERRASLVLTITSRPP